MATRYYCTQHPSLRVRRNDGTYIAFTDGVADVYEPRDAAYMDQFPFIRRGEQISDIPADQRGPNLDEATLNWWSPILGVGDGYGNSAEKMIRALDRAGKNVSLEYGYQVAGETLIRDIMDRPLRHGDVRLAYCPPHPAYWKRRYPGQACIGFTMWEDDRVPDSWTPCFPTVDVVATCSRFNAELFAKHFNDHGIQTPIVYVPLGVEHALFPYKRRSYRHGEQPFVFLHSATGMNEHRKGAMEAYQAFRNAFTQGENVKIIFRAKFGQLDVGGDPRVEFRTGQITEAQKNDLLQEAHAFVYPSFGEGFGLIPLEAVASGLPTICSSNSAMLDYADLVYGVGCDPEPSRISVPWQTHSLGMWARPRHIELVGRMREIYGDYQRATTFAAKAAKKVRADWGYDRSAKALLSAIEVARAQRDATRCSLPDEVSACS